MLRSALSAVLRPVCASSHCLKPSFAALDLSRPFAAAAAAQPAAGSDVFHARYGECKKRSIRASPQKLNEICRQIRGLRADDALLQMQFSPKRKARVVGSIVQNAVNLADILCTTHELEPEDLYVVEAYVTKSFTMKKIAYHSKGRNGIKRRRWAHITVKVEEINFEAAVQEAAKIGGRKGERALKKAQDDLDAYRARQAARGEVGGGVPAAPADASASGGGGGGRLTG